MECVYLLLMIVIIQETSELSPDILKYDEWIKDAETTVKKIKANEKRREEYQINKDTYIHDKRETNTVSASKTKQLTPFAYPQFYKIADRHAGMAYFSNKMGIDNYLKDFVVLKRTHPYLQWQRDFEAIQERIRNIDACSLRKTDPKIRAEDAVSEIGLKNCLEQCKLENKMYFQFLNNKLQKLVKKFDMDEIRLCDIPVYNNPPKKYYSCAKKGYKRYICECTYHKYAIKTSEGFKKKFHKIIAELYGLSPSPDNCKMLEDKHKMPMKLISFLIACHLVPTEIFGFLLWWHTTDNPQMYTTTTTTINPSFLIDDESSSEVFGDE